MYTPDGVMHPATVIETSPCYVVDVKTKSVDGYDAVKLGFALRKSVKKPVAGQLKKAGVDAPLKHLREFRIPEGHAILSCGNEEGKKWLKVGDVQIAVGDAVHPSMFFAEGDIVSVSGTSKGRGFQGVVGRYDFRGGPKTHGQSDRHRARGSLGSGTTPGRVFKGLRMAGRDGNARTTIKNLKVIAQTDTSITISGLIPGKKGGLIEVRNV